MGILHKNCTFLPGIAWLLSMGLWFGYIAPTSVHAADLGPLPDPTRPYTGSAAGAPPPEATGPVLQSTIISPVDRRAVISGRSYRVGDRVDGAVVADIQSYEVTLKRGGRESRLRLLPRLVKDPKVPPSKTPGNNG